MAHTELIRTFYCGCASRRHSLLLRYYTFLFTFVVDMQENIEDSIKKQHWQQFSPSRIKDMFAIYSYTTPEILEKIVDYAFYLVRLRYN